MPQPFLLTRTAIGIALGAVAVVAVLVVALFVRSSNVTYVKVVDKESALMNGSPAPGADLNGVQITKSRNGKVYFASNVVSSSIRDGADGNENQHKDARLVLGNPDEDPGNGYVSLGGGEIVVQVNTSFDAGDELTIHEFGSATGGTPEYYDVYVAEDAEGPWELVGTGSGPTTVVNE